MKTDPRLLLVAALAAIYSALPPGLRPVYQVLANGMYYVQRMQSLAQAAIGLASATQRLQKKD